jgi:SAM-dependent methyltransferase
VEEVLGIAYPPLDEGAPEQDAMSYAPSGYAEITHAFDLTGLCEENGLLDLGCGLGKVLLLARLLTGARVFGIERHGELAALARSAARRLAVSIELIEGDARELSLPDTDVTFLYLPFSGPALSTVLARLGSGAASNRARWLCSAPLDARYHATYAPAGLPSSWLQVYERR